MNEAPKRLSSEVVRGMTDRHPDFLAMAGKSAYTEWVDLPDKYWTLAWEATLKHNRKMATMTFFDRTPQNEEFGNVEIGTCVNLGLGYQKFPHIINWHNIKQGGE